MNQIDREVREAVERLVEQMAEKQGVTEQMKEENPMEWVRWMNSIKVRAEEMVLEDVLYK